jgi:hypothetical protein
VKKKIPQFLAQVVFGVQVLSAFAFALENAATENYYSNQSGKYCNNVTCKSYYRYQFYEKIGFFILTVLRIHDILVWIQIRIRESMPLTNGSGFESGSCYFRQ